MCEYTIVIHLTIDGCLGCFWNLAVMNHAAMNILVFTF